MRNIVNHMGTWNMRLRMLSKMMGWKGNPNAACWFSRTMGLQPSYCAPAATAALETVKAFSKRDVPSLSLFTKTLKKRMRRVSGTVTLNFTRSEASTSTISVQRYTPSCSKNTCRLASASSNVVLYPTKMRSLLPTAKVVWSTPISPGAMGAQKLKTTTYNRSAALKNFHQCFLIRSLN